MRTVTAWLTSIGHEKIAKAILAKGFEREKNPGSAEFIEEKQEGDIVILVTRQAGMESEEIVLVREEGVLRLDMDATEERISRKHRG